MHLSHAFCFVGFAVGLPFAGIGEMKTPPPTTQTALIRAISETNSTALVAILSSGNPAEIPMFANGSALQFAVTSSSCDIVSTLVRYGASINLQDQAGASPLHHAASRNKITMVAELLRLGANVDAVDHYGCTPLHYAASSSVASNLLSKGAQLYIKDKQGLSPVHHALFYSDRSQLDLLLLNSMERDAFLAVAIDDIDMLRAFQRGPYPALGSLRFGLSGQTLLHMAIRWKAPRCTQFLMANNSELLKIKDIEGLTPEDYARIALNRESLDPTCDK